MKSLVRITVVLLLCLPVAAQAQLQALQAFLPKACSTNASAVAGNGAKLITVFNAGFYVPTSQEQGAPTVYSGMDVQTGEAKFWGYAFLMPNDSIESVYMVRVPFLGCVDPSTFVQDLPTDGLDFEGGRTELPPTFMEGTAIYAALSTSNQFTAFRAAYPDSQPTFSILTSAPESALGVSEGDVVWILNWAEFGGEPGGDTSGIIPFTCVINTTTGKTYCGTEIVQSVYEYVIEGSAVAPNPTTESARLTLPVSWIGKPVTVECVSTTGSSTVLFSASVLPTQSLTISMQNLSTGSYMLRAHNGQQAVSHIMNVLK